MSGTMTSTGHTSVSCHRPLNPVNSFILWMWRPGRREVKQLAQGVTGRKWQSRNPKPSPPDASLLSLYLLAPPYCLHIWQAWLDRSLQAISKSGSPAHLRNNPICERGGEFSSTSFEARIKEQVDTLNHHNIFILFTEAQKRNLS